MIFPPKSRHAAISRPTLEVFLPKQRLPTCRNTANAPFSPATPISRPPVRPDGWLRGLTEKQSPSSIVIGPSCPGVLIVRFFLILRLDQLFVFYRFREHNEYFCYD